MGSGQRRGNYCYNYYTPNHYVCGCFATAIAQIMYYHRYPTERILPGEPIWASVNKAGGSPGGWSVGTDGAGSYTLSSGGPRHGVAGHVGARVWWRQHVFCITCPPLELHERPDRLRDRRGWHVTATSRSVKLSKSGMAIHIL